MPAGSIIGALYHKLQTQSRALEGGRNYRPKHVELMEIVDKIIIVASSWLFILLYYRNYAGNIKNGHEFKYTLFHCFND